VRPLLHAVIVTGTVVERFARFGVYDGELYRAPDLAVARDGSVYVGDAGGRVQKFVRGPE
jgi:hypothetical protein